ncbi:MAG: hypothetical protein OXC98_05025 [bacterium]|nr:hypothetical protein [bacterium]
MDNRLTRLTPGMAIPWREPGNSGERRVGYRFYTERSPGGGAVHWRSAVHPAADWEIASAAGGRSTIWNLLI